MLLSAIVMTAIGHMPTLQACVSMSSESAVVYAGSGAPAARPADAFYAALVPALEVRAHAHAHALPPWTWSLGASHQPLLLQCACHQHTQQCERSKCTIAGSLIIRIMACWQLQPINLTC